MSRVFAESVAAYVQAGWPCVLPVPALDKFPPPVGFTGAAGRDTDTWQLVTWAGSHADHSIALRMPDGVIGIDVDHYTKGEPPTQIVKRGAETLAEREAAWGPLPATWSSTARGGGEGPGPSRILFFRVPAQRYATKLGGDVEIIQRHHRYAVVAPSPHAAAGAPYRWYRPDGTPAKPEEVPGPADLAELPTGWVAGLAEGSTEQGPAAADTPSGKQLLVQLLTDTRTECAEITSARLLAYSELSRADEGSRHDTMTARTHHLVQLAAHGHAGAGGALVELRELWAKVTAGEARELEFEQMLLTSARKAVTVVGERQVAGDPCILAQGFVVAAPGPADDRPDDPEHPADPSAVVEPIQPPRWWSVREVIGTHAFDPQANLDQSLGQAVLERTYPLLRYAYDAGGWLLRVNERWEAAGDLSKWAVAQVAGLMPSGDPQAGKGSAELERSARRARFNNAAGAGAIAGKITALVAGGMHPCALRLGDLDSEPDVVWAGGLPYDLRQSADAPMLARIDPATPHLHSAALAPETRSTPLWDAFLAAVWPDPGIRAWALRVLGITLTGYPDRALPILLGETGRGKTQVVTLLMSVLGSYAHAADPRLLGTADNAHASIVYALKGRRLSFIDEGPREGRWAQERLKQLTGGSELTANQMHKDPVTFRPTHTLVLTANDEPVLTDPAIRARVRLIPCEGDPDAISAARAAIGHVNAPAWRTEAPGVLAAMMREAARWLADPSSALVTAAPDSISFLAEVLGADQDPIKVWLEDETEPYDPGTGSRELYQAFRSSCLRSGTRADLIPSETKWGRAVTRLGYPSLHTIVGKRRKLRVRPAWSTDTMPVTPVAPPVQTLSHDDGLGANHDGLMTGSQTNPSGTNPQVRPHISDPDDGLTGQIPSIAHTHTRTGAHAPAHAQKGTYPFNPSSETGNSASDLGKRQNPTRHEGAKPSTMRDSATAKPKSPAAEARAATKAAERAAGKARAKLEAIATAGGAVVQLPALVVRDPATPGATSVRAVPLDGAGQLLDTVTRPGHDLTVDIENTGYPLGHEDYALRTVQLGTDVFAVVLDPSDPEQADVARRQLAAAAVLHAHSATADLVPLAHAGLVDADSAWERMHDTVIPAKLADPTMTGAADGLKQLSVAVLGDQAASTEADAARAELFKAGGWLKDIKVTTPVTRSGWAQTDPRSTTMIRYAACDVLDDAALARRLPAPDPAVLERERTAQRMTARVAHVGLRIDGDHVRELLAEHEPLRAQLAERIKAFGVDNPGSPTQVAVALEQLGPQLPRTKTGRASAAADVLEQLRDVQGTAGELVALVLDHRKHDTAIGTFLEPYQRLVDHGDGRARPTIYTLEAETGRMSAVRPNLQQVPREGGFRACITADPGTMLVSADFSGVELRVAAALSQDANLARMIANGIDLHWEIARQVFGPDATKADRYKVKRGVFGRVYGGGVPTLARQVGVSEQVAGAMVDTLDSLTPGLSEWSRQIREGVKAGRTQFPTYAGRIAHLPADFPHKAPNFCIQGTARELLVDALIRWRDTRWGRCVLLPVHDELLVVVPEDEATEATDQLVAAMSTELYGVPIIAEPSAPSFAWEDAA